MYPDILGEVVFRDAYAAQGSDAPVYLMWAKNATHATIYPKDHKLRTYPPHDPMMLCPPNMEDVPLAKLRMENHPAAKELAESVSNGKYRTVSKLLKQDPLLDPHGDYDLPHVFVALSIEDMTRWRKTTNALLGHGASLSGSFKHNHSKWWTLAHEAVMYRQYEKFDELVERGLPTRNKEWGMDLLDVAMSYRCFDAMGALLLRGFTSDEFNIKAKAMGTAGDHYDRKTYQPCHTGGITLPLPHRAMLRTDTTPLHLQIVMEAYGTDRWTSARDHNHKTAFEMAEQIGGAQWEAARRLRSHLEHHELNAVSVRSARSATLGRRL